MGALRGLDRDASREERDIIKALLLDRSALAIAALSDESDEKAYWLSKTPAERLEALELMRQILYGYDPSSTRLQRVLEVDELSSG